MKKRIWAGMLVLILATLACGTGAPTQQVDSVATVVASTLQALTASAPPATQAAPTSASGTQFTFQNVSLVIPKELASGASAKTIAAITNQDGPWWGIAPEHIEITLNDYNLAPGYFADPIIEIYPAQDYISLNESVGKSIGRVQAINSGSATPAADNLPYVPFYNAGQMFAAQIKTVQFQGGAGVREITEYGQAPGPIKNSGTFYHFEGLTSDGKYYVVAILSINAPFPDGSVQYPGDNYSDPHFYDNYYQAVTDKMNSSGADTFKPSLSTLDALIQSITIK